jgi:hypothetical protein
MCIKYLLESAHYDYTDNIQNDLEKDWEIQSQYLSTANQFKLLKKLEYTRRR